jgi:hypothetical protein
MIAASTWPGAYDPARSPVFTHNELQTALSAQQLWPTLIRATAWPRWYSNVRRVVLPAGHSELAPGLTFSWTTFGVPVTSTVRESVPGRRLAWDGKALGSTGHHRRPLRRSLRRRHLHSRARPAPCPDAQRVGRSRRFGSTPWQAVARALIGRLPAGPSDQQLATGATHVWARVSAPDGREAVATPWTDRSQPSRASGSRGGAARSRRRP